MCSELLLQPSQLSILVMKIYCGKEQYCVITGMAFGQRTCNTFQQHIDMKHHSSLVKGELLICLLLVFNFREFVTLCKTSCFRGMVHL